MEIFKFGKDDITRYIEYELKTLSKFREPLNYTIKALEKLGHSLTIKSLDKKIDLNKVKEHEGKNYQWSVFNYKNVTLAIRRYRQHLTVFTKVRKDGVDFMDDMPKVEYGAFTLETDMEKFGDKHDEMLDKYYSKPFTDLNVIAKDLFKLLTEKDGSVYSVWNSVSLPRPDHVKIELSFASKIISSLDNFVFCMEELENIYLSLFAESTTIQIIKELKTGDSLGERYKVGKITTTIKDEYYHSVGLEMIDTMNKNEKMFHDVYSLTRWYFNEICKNKIYIFKGDIYVEGGVFKVGEPVAYKNIDGITLFKKTLPKENFIPLNKY